MRSSKVYLVLLATVIMSVLSTSTYAIAGTNCYSVPDGNSGYNFGASPIPAGFFGLDSDLFIDNICLRGGDADGVDTIIERLDPFSFVLPCSSASDPIQIEIIALNLVSCTPITVTYNGGFTSEE